MWLNCLESMILFSGNDEIQELTNIMTPIYQVRLHSIFQLMKINYLNDLEIKNNIVVLYQCLRLYYEKMTLLMQLPNR